MLALALAWLPPWQGGRFFSFFLQSYYITPQPLQAESEMFDHSCGVIERRLEAFVEKELKTDRFLVCVLCGPCWEGQIESVALSARPSRSSAAAYFLANTLAPLLMF